MSDCSLVHLDVGNDKVYPSSYDPMTEYPTGSQERKSSTYFSKEEEEGEGEKE